MGHRLDVIISCAKRPSLWPEAARYVLRRVVQSMRPRTGERCVVERQRAFDWCQANAISCEEALSGLGCAEGLRVLDDRAIKVAQERARQCPFRMGGAGNLELIYTLAEVLQAKTIVETGVAYGWSSLAFLLSLRNRAAGSLYSIDRPYFDFDNARWVGIVVPEELKERWTLYKMPDRRGIPKALRDAGAVDLVHYDSDKTYEGRMRSYPILWEALRPGGIFVSDDIGDNLAFRDFCRNVGEEGIVIGHEGKYQGVIVRRG